MWFCRLACQTKMCDLESKFTVTQFFLKDRSEEKVPNFALDIVSTGGIFSRWGILIFMYNWIQFSCTITIMSYWTLTCWGWWKATIESSGGDLCYAGCVRDMIMMYGWVKITDFSLFLKNIVSFCLFSCIYSILRTEHFVGKKYCITSKLRNLKIIY